MTSSTNRASLIERLEAEDPFRMSNDGMTVAELPPPGKLRNPDGPAAAALIRELERVLQIIGDESSWRGFSPLAQVDRMRELAASATLRAKASKLGAVK